MLDENMSIIEQFALAFKEHQQGNLLDAERFYNKILKSDPEHFDTIFLLGTLSAQIGKFDIAKKLMQKAIVLKPQHADSHNNLGNVYKELNNPTEAIKSYKMAIKINPKNSDSHNNLGVVYARVENYQKSINSYQESIKINPKNSMAYNNLGLLHKDLDDNKKALTYINKAIEIDPKNADAYNNLGIVNKNLDDYKNAILCYEKAIKINPKHADAYNNLGIVYKDIGNHEKAFFCYEKSIGFNPLHVDAHKNYSHILLQFSKFQQGFREYEWRKKYLIKNYYKDFSLETAEWKGEDLKNKTILILSEQGMGDIIQFARYLYMIDQEYSVNIIFRTKKKLAHLFKKSKFEIISEEDSIPKHDFHQFLLSLPMIFYEKNKKIPKQINYIHLDNENLLKWKNRISLIKGIKIGFCWQGSASFKYDRSRSIPLNLFNELLNIENINFINLQKGYGVEQIEKSKYNKKIYNFSNEVDIGCDAFLDTIGILKNIDLVISPDTAVAHISSTLGVKTWLLLPFSADWRWLLKTKHSPWYESMKIYRQDKINNWDAVFNLMKKDLINEFNL